jgi:hypothetical protein
MSLFSLLKKNASEGPAILPHPTCLYLDWPNSEAQWLTIDQLQLQLLGQDQDQKQQKQQWKTTVQWKELGCDILISTNCPSTQDPKFKFNEGYDEYKSVPYLKSHLQKCIRRSNSFKAIKTAAHLYILDCSELLKRLSIIAVEDAIPIDGFSTLVWMYAACRAGYNLSDEHLCWILGYVHDLCQCKYYEQFAQPQQTAVQRDLKALRLRTLPPAGRNLCYSLMFRQQHQRPATKGDKTMLQTAATIWATRFRVNSEFIDLLSRKLIFVSPPFDGLNRNEWISAAIDYHCYPGIVLNIIEKHDEFNQEDIREAIWHCSSCLTNKANIAEDLKQRDKDSVRHNEVWKVIKRDFLSLARFMITKNA